MLRFTGVVVLGVFVLALCLPETSEGAIPRVRALAGGDPRLLPDDDGTIQVFPNRLVEHKRIILNNLAPDGHPGDYGAFETLIDAREEFENAETWAEASWEWLGGVTQIGLNRPTRSTFLQNYRLNPNTNPTVPAAGSMIDVGYSNGDWGFLGNFGVSASEGDRTNWFLDGVYGWRMGARREIAVSGSFNHIVQDDVFDLGVDLRNDRGRGFFDHWVGSAAYSHTDLTDTFAFDWTLLHFRDASRGVANGLSHLVAAGATLSFVSVDGGDNLTVLSVPNVTAGAEYAVKPWLSLLGSVTRRFSITFTSGSNSASAGSTTATLGALASWGSLSFEAVVENALFESGPDFIGGNADGIASFVSISYGLE